MEDVQSILNIPAELHVQIKSYLSNEDCKRYNFTCKLISCHRQSKSECNIRNCGLYDLALDSHEPVLERIKNFKWWYCYHLNCIKHVIDNNEDLTINYIKSNDYKILKNLCRNGQIEIFKYILDHERFNFKFNDLRSGHYEIILYSCGNGHLNIIKYIKKKFNLTRSEFMLNDYIRFASRNGHLHIVKYLVEEIGLTVNAIRGLDGRNMVLYSTISGGHLNILKYLIEKVGLTIEDVRGVDGSNLILRRACESGYFSIVRYLIEKVGLTIEDVRALNNNALRSASRGGYLLIVKYLIEEVGLTKEDIRGYQGSRESIKYSFINGHYDVANYLESRLII